MGTSQTLAEGDIAEEQGKAAHTQHKHHDVEHKRSPFYDRFKRPSVLLTRNFAAEEPLVGHGSRQQFALRIQSRFVLETGRTTGTHMNSRGLLRRLHKSFISVGSIRRPFFTIGQPYITLLLHIATAATLT